MRSSKKEEIKFQVRSSNQTYRKRPECWETSWWRSNEDCLRECRSTNWIHRLQGCIP